MEGDSQKVDKNAVAGMRLKWLLPQEKNNVGLESAQDIIITSDLSKSKLQCTSSAPESSNCTCQGASILQSIAEMFADFKTSVLSEMNNLKNDISMPKILENLYKMQKDIMDLKSLKNSASAELIEPNQSDQAGPSYVENDQDLSSFDGVQPSEDDCGVCRTKCSTLLICDPCGHFPFCVDCTTEMKKKKNNVPLMSRNDDWATYMIMCPTCNSKVANLLPVVKVLNSSRK